MLVIFTVKNKTKLEELIMTVVLYSILIAAIIGTLLLIWNPLDKLIKMGNGKTKEGIYEEVKKEIDDNIEIEDKESDEYHLKGLLFMVWKGCTFVLFIFFSIIFSTIIQPLVILFALVNRIGSQPIAYAMLVIVILWWISFSRGLTTKGEKAKKKEEVVVMTLDDGSKKEMRKKEDGSLEEIVYKKTGWYTFRRIMFSLPTLYLWYVFLVLILS